MFPSLSVSRSLLTVSLGLICAGISPASPVVFLFDNAQNPLAAATGLGTISYYDPETSGWGDASTQFGKASSFGLPAMMGGDPDVMGFPACTPQQGYLLTTGFEPNGALAETFSSTSNYTVIYDIYYPPESGGNYRALLQTDPLNSGDADFFLENTANGGVGINSNYRGTVTTGAWHRIAISVRAAVGEGQAQRYIDGQFVGAIGTTGSGLEDRFGLQPEVLLLADNDNETQPGYLSSFLITDRAMNAAEITALGGPNAAGAGVPGPAAPLYTEKMSRRVEAIGHRGGSFGSYPDNTLPAIQHAFLDGAKGVEIDTRLTADGVAVLFHDATLERTTNGTGNVADLTLSELKLLDAGTEYDPAFTGTRVPTLTEALTEAKGKGIVYLDIKTDGQEAAFKTAVDASGFPLSDLWFWTPGDPLYAAQIRSVIPGAQIMWGNPDANWETDPGYFQGLRDIGVIGFSIGNGTDTPDLNFAAKAKAAGFIVEVYTINDPETMRRCSDAGVDYMETDFPSTVVALQPPAPAKASNPAPPDAGIVGSAITTLRWLSADGTTKHRIHLGTVNPPPFVSEQTSDLYQSGLLSSSQTYYWRVDEVTSGGTVTGGVWTFTTPPPASGTILEWEFDGQLSSALGNAVLEFADGENTRTQVSFETTDGLDIRHINGVPASIIRIPQFSSATDGLSLIFPAAVAPNGGGQFVNRYSFVFDIYMPSVSAFCAFFNTDPSNGNDADFFINGSGAIGIAALGYSGNGVIQSGVWHRVIFSADLTAGNVSYYVDGVLVKSRAGAALTDGRFSLVSGTAPGPHVRLLNDENGEMTEMLVNSIAFIDAPLTAGQALELGGARSSGIFFAGAATLPPVSLTRTGNSVSLTWAASAGRRLQRSTTLSGWVDIPGTEGQNTFTETIQPGLRMFYRAAE